MNDDRELESRVKAWLEGEAPSHLPDWALRETFARTRATRQESGLRAAIAARIPWLGPRPEPHDQRRMMMLSSIAAIAVALFVVSGGVFLSVREGPGDDLVGTFDSEPGEWIVFEHFGQAPDGSTTELDFDNRMIWLVKPDGSELHELAPGQPADGKVAPDVSPDGTKVVFSSWTPRSQVYEVAIDGTEPVLLTTHCSGLVDQCQEWDPAYSPDGSRIAFVRYECGGLSGFGTPRCSGPGRSLIGIRDLASGEVTLLEETRVSQDEGWLNQPTWSPDGTEIAYHRASVPAEDFEYPRPTSLWIAEADGSGVRKLVTPGVGADPDWSPDGTRIAYSSVGYRESEGAPFGTPKAEIWTIAPDGTDARLVCDGNVDAGCWAPTWMPGGEEILHWGYQSFDRMKPDGSDKRPVAADGRLRWFGDVLGYGYFGIWQPRLVTP
jgi:Tol biopolymer transport system component